MALASLESSALSTTSARHSAHPSPPPADDIKHLAPLSPAEEKSSLSLLDQKLQALPQSRSPRSFPLSPPSDHHSEHHLDQTPASPAPSDQVNMDDLLSPEAAKEVQVPDVKAEECILPPAVTAPVVPTTPVPSEIPKLVAKNSELAPTPALTPSEAKQCRQLVILLKKHNSSWPFLSPVNPAAVGAPDYFDIIKEPMDLSTVDQKLAQHRYGEVQSVANDVQLMLNNCFRYNPSTNPVHQAGKALETYFSLQLNKLFPALSAPASLSSPPAKADDAKSAARRHSKRQIKPPRVFEPESAPSVKKSRNSISSISGRRHSVSSSAMMEDDDEEADSSDDDGVSQQISTLASCLATINQQLALLTEKKKPKRKRSSTSALPVEATPKKRRASKPKIPSRSSTGSPAPDVMAEDIMPQAATAAGPDKSCEYCGTNETPMWRRGPSGCGTLCNKCGVKWRNGKIMGDNRVPVVPIYSANTPFRPKPKARKLDANGNPSKPRGRCGRKKGAKAITYEQKKELSELIPTLNEDDLGGVFEIIRSGLPHLRDTQEEIEIDIDTIDDVTLFALYDFVKTASGTNLPPPLVVQRKVAHPAPAAYRAPAMMSTVPVGGGLSSPTSLAAPGPRGLTSLSPSDEGDSDSGSESE